jgi:hypothetical protein
LKSWLLGAKPGCVALMKEKDRIAAGDASVSGNPWLS